MANAKMLHWGPNTTKISLNCVGVSSWGNANFRVCVQGNANFSVFRYQHVGIGYAKSSGGGFNPMRGPNDSGFASE